MWATNLSKSLVQKIVDMDRCHEELTNAHLDSKKTIEALTVDVVRLMQRISKLERKHEIAMELLAREALEDAKNDDPVCPKCAGEKDAPQCDWPGHTLTLHRWEEEYN